MNLYEITFNNEGSLVNPVIESPIFVKSTSQIDAIIFFLNKCKKDYKQRDLKPNDIKCELIVEFDSILK